MLLFAALASLSHAFVREVEGHTLTMLRLVASPTAIALGKLLFNLLFLARDRGRDGAAVPGPDGRAAAALGAVPG